jgi:hypothetical protein
MSTPSIRRGAVVLTVTGALLFAVLISAQAASAGTFYACVKKNGTARVFTKKPKCKKGESKLSWNTQGPAGKTGENGTNGINGTNGLNGSNGTNGTTGFTNTLPTGKTEVGTWGAFMAESLAYIPISFNIPLASKPESTIIGLKGAPTTECPGSPAKPQATSGLLCIYTAQLVGATLFQFDPIVEGGGVGADVFGVILGMSGAKGNYGYGTWAVTG